MEFVNTINDVFYRARVVWTSQNKLFVTYIFVVYVSYRIGYDVDASMQPTAWILCVRIIICKNTMLINYDGINWMEFEGIGERIRRRHSVKRMQCIWPVFENVRVCKDMWSKWLLHLPPKKPSVLRRREILFNGFNLPNGGVKPASYVKWNAQDLRCSNDKMQNGAQSVRKIQKLACKKLFTTTAQMHKITMKHISGNFELNAPVQRTLANT